MAKGKANGAENLEPTNSVEEAGLQLEVVDGADDNSAVSQDEIEALLEAMAVQNAADSEVAEEAPEPEPQPIEEQVAEVVDAPIELDVVSQDVEADVKPDLDNPQPEPLVIAETAIDDTNPEVMDQQDSQVQSEVEPEIELNSAPIGMDELLKAAADSTSLSVEQIKELESAPNIEAVEDEPDVESANLDDLLATANATAEPSAGTSEPSISETVAAHPMWNDVADGKPAELEEAATAPVAASKSKMKLPMPKLSFGSLKRTAPFFLSGLIVCVVSMGASFALFSGKRDQVKQAKLEKSVANLQGIVATQSDRLAKYDEHFERALLASSSTSAQGHDQGHADETVQNDHADSKGLGHGDAHGSAAESGQAPSDHADPSNGEHADSKSPGHTKDIHKSGGQAHDEHSENPAKPAELGYEGGKSEDHGGQSGTKSHSSDNGEVKNPAHPTADTHGAEGFAIPKAAKKPVKRWSDGSHKIVTTADHKAAAQGHSTAKHAPAKHGPNSGATSSHSKSSNHSLRRHSSGKNIGKHRPTHRGAKHAPAKKSTGIVVYLDGKRVNGSPTTSDSH